jgi:hypothetical protein
MSRFRNCHICKASYHWCISCNVYGEEEAAYENDVCTTCFTNSGAAAVWNKRFDLDQEIRRLLEEFARNPKDPNYSSDGENDAS